MSNISNEKWGVLNKQLENLGVNRKKIVEKFILGSGSGGQKINKTSATVQLTYDSFPLHTEKLGTEIQPIFCTKN